MLITTASKKFAAAYFSPAQDTLNNDQSAQSEQSSRGWLRNCGDRIDILQHGIIGIAPIRNGLRGICQRINCAVRTAATGGIDIEMKGAAINQAHARRRWNCEDFSEEVSFEMVKASGFAPVVEDCAAPGQAVPSHFRSSAPLPPSAQEPTQ